ncbi:MAG: formylglycine-generating enzyme family protein [Treponema sp.]|jgi:formylglycine-generating enzyme required for sulfatase activity|nr:formylglycine-generating enzyme family protein [Treponema sp.]
MTRTIWFKAAFAAALVTVFTACPHSSGGGGYTFSTSEQVTIVGDDTYAYDLSNDDYKGVFIAGRTVTLSPFTIAKYETTYELWKEVYDWATDSAGRGGNVYTFANAGRQGGNSSTGPVGDNKHPVTEINWRDAIVWCNAYSEKSGKEPVYYTDTGYGTVLRESTNTSGTSTVADLAVMKPGANGYRLPTEAEWEYAARGGGVPAANGSFTNKWAGTNDENSLGTYAWYNGNAGSDTHPVGTREVNAFDGPYDMSGNVWEWCWDRYESPLATGAVTNPVGPSTGSDRIVRGGSWNSPASYCTVAGRGDISPDDRDSNIGFRVVSL